MKRPHFTWRRSHALVLGLAMLMLLVILFGYTLQPSNTVLLKPEVVWQEVGSIWPKIFFSVIQDKNRNVGIEDLQTHQIPEGAYEIRVYSGFGLQSSLDLLVLTLSDRGVQSAHYPHSRHDPITKDHPDPVFWNALCRHGIFDLPDSSLIKDYPRIRDGVGYVVEIKSGKAYRHYQYGNPSHSDSREAKSMVRIVNLLKAHTTFETIPERSD